MSEVKRTGELFLCHPVLHPRIDFGPGSITENKKYCRKNYGCSDSYSPGIFTVLCTCLQPVLIGFPIMVQNEGTRTALSVVLNRFKILPRVTYYDSTCKMMHSFTLRVPWVAEMTIIVCDRFRYRNHKCNSVHDPDSYPSCRIHASSGAESANNLFAFSKSHIRILTGSNLIPFLAAASVFLNVRAKITAVKGKNSANVDEEEFRYFLSQNFICDCIGCSKWEKINDFVSSKLQMKLNIRWCFYDSNRIITLLIPTEMPAENV